MSMGWNDDNVGTDAMPCQTVVLAENDIPMMVPINPAAVPCEPNFAVTSAKLLLAPVGLFCTDLPSSTSFSFVVVLPVVLLALPVHIKVPAGAESLMFRIQRD